MKRIKSILLAIAIATTATVFLNSCQEDAPEINYTMNVSVTNDFSEVVKAINDGSLKNEAAIQELAKAIDKLSGDQQTKLQAILDVLTSLNTTLETKLALIEAAMKAQTLSLEGKLSLLETAIKNQTIKQEEMAGKLTDAIDNLAEDMDEKLQDIAEVIGGVDTTIETKLALIEAAINAQTLSFESKLDLLEDALNNQTIKQEELAGLLADAIDSLAEDMDEKLQDIAEVIGDVDTTIETKLALIEAAINAQTLSLEGKLALLETAIKNLPDYSSQLEAIKTAIAGLPDYSDKLDALKTAISALPDYSSKFDAVVSALNGIKTQAEAISTGQTGIATQIGNVVSAIEDLIDEVSSGNTDAAAALAAIIQKLEDLKTAIENIETGGGSGSGSGSGSGDSPEGALKGKFSVGAGKQVQFSKGNLVATIDASGTPTAWKFAANQYDCLGAGGVYDTIGSAAGDIDLFGWSTDSNTRYGINTSKDDSDYYGIFRDWGNKIGDGSTWRTLTKAEWVYLFEKHSYKWVTVNGVNGYVIAPDDFTGTLAGSYADDDALAADNLVFLPAAGYRNGSDVDGVGDDGIYWSSTAFASNRAYDVYFSSSDVSPDGIGIRSYGYSVRLITECQ